MSILKMHYLFTVAGEAVVAVVAVATVLAGDRAAAGMARNPEAGTPGTAVGEGNPVEGIHRQPEGIHWQAVVVRRRQVAVRRGCIR